MKRPLPAWLDSVGTFLLVILASVAVAAGLIFIKLEDAVWLRDRDFVQVRKGKASWYSGGGMEAACRYYPIGSYVRVDHGNAHIVVKITSRGPAWRFMRKGRIIDLSRTAFLSLAFLQTGLLDVTVQAVPEPTPSDLL